MKAIALGMLVAAGCTDPRVAPGAPANDTPVGPAYLEVQFTDSSSMGAGVNAPGTVENVPPPAPQLWVEVSRIEIEHAAGAWTTIAAEPQRFDLFEVGGGNAAVVASSELAAGGYRQVAVEIDAATLVAGGVSQDITIVHGSVLLPVSVSLADAMPYALVLDLDGVKSLTVDGSMAPALSVASFGEM